MKERDTIAELEAYVAMLRADIERKSKGDPAMFGQQIADRQRELELTERQLARMRKDTPPTTGDRN